MAFDPPPKKKNAWKLFLLTMLIKLITMHCNESKTSSACSWFLRNVPDLRVFKAFRVFWERETRCMSWKTTLSACLSRNSTKEWCAEHRGRGATTSMFLHWKFYIGYSSNMVYKTEKYHQRLSEFYAQWRHGTWWWRGQDQTGKPNTSQAGLKISSTSSRPTVAAQKQHQQHFCSGLTQAVQEQLQS